MFLRYFFSFLNSSFFLVVVRKFLLIIFVPKSEVLKMIDVTTFMNYGLNLSGFSLHRIMNTDEKTNLDRFVSSYGLSPSTCLSVYDDIVSMCLEEHKKPPRRKDMFLMTLCWFKTHGTERTLAGTFGVIE